ncbi:hypothetical protein IH879_02680 [candidate division KSB1 bacterium]|nr:hypothetical protein [candidate division KSB1 bacterium]
MTQLSFKIEDALAARFKDLCSRKFNGDDALAFETALKYLLSNEDRRILHFEQIVEQIQDEIDTAGGGLTEKQIDDYIAAYRRKRTSQRT